MHTASHFQGELVAWYLNQEYGLQGLLHVADEHRGRGLASCIIASMQKLTADLGMDEVVVIWDENEASRRLYQKLGMEPGEAVVWAFPRRAQKEK
jgi:predicted GNAT family acetyltransferase